mgnify:FL=1|jgi:hypothetical protein|tara:strand:+ start:415 stop:657 length:243 start_codon:yes stop_codon:yes gene_type:complete
MSAEMDKKFKEFNQWYQHHHATQQPTRDLGRQVAFLSDALDETIFLLAHACKSIRALEGREGSGLVLPGAVAQHKGVSYG